MRAKPEYQRILLKLSGEALLGEEDYGIDPDVIGRIASEILEVLNTGVQIAIVIGGGNIFRGAGLAESGIDRVTGDHMGMLATLMNSLALQAKIRDHSLVCLLKRMVVRGQLVAIGMNSCFKMKL